MKGVRFLYPNLKFHSYTQLYLVEVNINVQFGFCCCGYQYQDQRQGYHYQLVPVVHSSKGDIIMITNKAAYDADIGDVIGDVVKLIGDIIDIMN